MTTTNTKDHTGAETGSPKFVGWRRQRGGKWQAVCDGATEREAWERLADLMNKDRPKSGRLTEGRPKPPADLAGEARAEWDRLTAELEAAGLLCRVDRSALVELCRSWADVVECRRIIAAEGRLIRTPIQTSKGE